MAYGTLPDNPIAFSNCTAKVKVDAARLRSGPSLNAPILGVRVQDSPIFVTKVVGKWVQVMTDDGESAFMAAYLLAFPAEEMLEQWKKDAPSPSVGKKAKVKWAQVNFRKYPSGRSPVMGHFSHNDEVAVLTDLGNGWSLVEARAAKGEASSIGSEGSGFGPEVRAFGFISNRALAAPDVPDPPYWITPLARVHLNPGQKMEITPRIESPAEYCARTAWTPELFAMQTMKAKGRRTLESQPRELLASR